MEHSLPVRYTCDGQDISPPLEWGAVPASTKSLALFLVALVPEPSSHTSSASLGWAVAGLNPSLHRLAAGHLPRGAYEGLTSNNKRNYWLCPPKGTRVEYQFELYGLPASETISHNFAGLFVLSALAGAANSNKSSGHGIFAVTYKRK